MDKKVNLLKSLINKDINIDLSEYMTLFCNIEEKSGHNLDLILVKRNSDKIIFDLFEEFMVTVQDGENIGV